MHEKAVLQLLGALGAVITNSHIVYTSGKHGSAYINKDALYPHTRETSQLCVELAEWFEPARVEVIIAPAIGGVILSQWTAYHLTKMTGLEVLGVYAEKAMRLGSPLWYICFGLRFLTTLIPQWGRAPEEYFTIKRGYDKLLRGKRVGIVEDLLTTGGSVRKVVEAVRAAGGNVVSVGVLANRGGVTHEDLGDVPKLHALVNITMDAWDESDCLLCAQGVPVNTDVGHGRQFLARKAG